METGIPILNGVLTVENKQQAVDRAGAKLDKGCEYANATIQILNLLHPHSILDGMLHLVLKLYHQSEHHLIYFLNNHHQYQQTQKTGNVSMNHLSPSLARFDNLIGE